MLPCIATRRTGHVLDEIAGFRTQVQVQFRILGSSAL